jgi:imidazolonepropionase-like amidohydrolase
MKPSAGIVAAGLCVAAASCREQPRSFVATAAPVIAIAHVRTIDGTGGAGKDDQTVIIDAGHIRTLGAAASLPAAPTGAEVIDGRGRTLIPGLVGMHEHLFYEVDGSLVMARAAFARLYLASGVTTIRTAGTADLDGDLRLKTQIDAGALPGPKIHATGGYLSRASGPPDPEGIARAINAQADRGATSFKAYTSLRRADSRRRSAPRTPAD